MDRTHFLFLAAISVIAGSPTLILLNYFKGADPYYFLTQSTFGEPILFHLIGWVPNSLVKFIPALFLLTTSILVYYIAKQTNNPPKTSSILTLSGATLLYRANIIEDDLPGLALGLISTYFYLKYQETKKLEHLAMIALPLITCYFVWKGVIIFPILFFIHYLYKNKHKTLALGTTALAIYKAVPNQILKIIQNQYAVNEHQLGLPHLALINIMLIPGLFTKQNNDFINTWTILLIPMAILSAQYVWLAIIPLAIRTSNFVKKLPEEKAKNFMMIAILIAVISSSAQLYQSAPQPQTMKFAKNVSLLTEDKPVNNSWELGYYLKYFGANPTKWGSPGPPKKNVEPEYKITRNKKECKPPIFNTTRYYFCRS